MTNNPLIFNTPTATIYIGRNAIQNDELTFSSVINDLWFHVKDFSGSHVILRTLNKEKANKIDIKIAASKALFYSHSPNKYSGFVEFCKISDAKKESNAAGEVTLNMKPRIIHI